MYGWLIPGMNWSRGKTPFSNVIPAIANLNPLSPPGYVDHQTQFYRPMAPPSYQQSPFYANLRPTPSPLPSSQTPDSDRRNSHSQHPKQHQQHQSNNPLSPSLHFHQQPQPSPSLSSIFPIQSASDHLAHSTSQPQENQNPHHHLSLPTAFSPSAFGLSPPAFLTDPSLAIAPTPPSNPQYATFPFDTATAQSGAALTPGAQSQTSGSHTASSETGNLEKDPFLSLLEQLAENEHSQGGPSELDFFLTGAVDGEGDVNVNVNVGGGEDGVSRGPEM